MKNPTLPRFAAYALVLALASCGAKKKPADEHKDNEVDPRPLRTQEETAEELELPSPEKRAETFDAYVAALERLDVEALPVRELKGLGADWRAALAPLRAEFLAATTTADLGRALLRVDATLPNLHSSLSLNEKYRWFPRGQADFPLTFEAVITAEGTQHFVVDYVDRKAWGLKAGEPSPIAADSRLLAINGRPISEWQAENNGLCKWPLATQCDRELNYNLSSELLSWKRGQDLVLTVSAGGQEKHVTVPVADRVTTAAQKAAGKERSRRRKECRNDSGRYAELYPVYEGNRLCAYRSFDDDAGELLVLRITSFSYSRSSLFEEQEIRSMSAEVAAFREWFADGETLPKRIVFDVAGNGGGNFPLPYYELFFRTAFQEQFFRLKKARDFDDPDLLSSAVWYQKALVRTINYLREEGLWTSTPWGELLPVLPSFCPDDSRDCRGQLFQPKEPIFAGIPVDIVMDHLCISACDAFVWTLKKRYTEAPVRLIGQPHASDAAFVRVRVDVLDDWSVRVSGLNDSEEDTLFTQTISSAQTSDENGAPLYGRPLPPDRFVEGWSWDPEWIDRALSDALPPAVE